MEKSYKKSTLYTALLVAFIDFFGVGLVYPLFSSMLFDSSYSLLTSETTQLMRGVWLGLLIALMPLTQFFFAPIWGALSDSRGRKKPLQLSLAIVFGGYIIAVLGVWANNIVFLLISRIIIGIASGNTAIVQAAIVDLSSPEKKGGHFGLYGMALGLGFSLGPFLGGVLSAQSYSIPFLFAALITAINFVFTVFFFEETHHTREERKLKLNMALIQLKKAFQLKEVKTLLIASFLYNFGWSYFFEFAPVYLIERFHFSSVELGFFYGIAGGLYALSIGLLIRPFIARMRAETLFFVGIFFAALAILTLPWIPSTIWLWPVIFLLCFFVSFVTPTSITLVSNSASSSVQGEALGNLNAANSASFVLSPLLSGLLVGVNPTFPMWFGGAVMLIAAFVVLVAFARPIFSKTPLRDKL